MGHPAHRYVTLEEFLVAEAADPSGERREWIDGQVVAIAGATPEHGRLCIGIASVLREKLRGLCTVRDGSVAIHIYATKAGLRPDVSVVCGPTTKTVVENNGKSAGEAITNPCILVEVLSESTERDDRGWKFRDYRTLPSLDEYVLVSQNERRIEVFRRSSSWAPESFGAGSTFHLHGIELQVNAVYDD